MLKKHEILGFATFESQAGDVIDPETTQVVKSDGKRKMSKRDKDELLKKSREQMR